MKLEYEEEFSFRHVVPKEGIILFKAGYFVKITQHLHLTQYVIADKQSFLNFHKM